ncbi:MAG: hypothetical protein ACSLE3_08445 [Microbacteriaceae bacterium]
MNQGGALQPGDTLTTATLSLCAGGLLQTWTEPGGPRLWSVPEARGLRSMQGTGVIGRSRRAPRRFRETALLSESTGTLLLQPRFPKRTEDGGLRFEAKAIRVNPAAELPTSTDDDVRALLVQSIRHCRDSGEFFVVERGGWNAPSEPFCLFILLPEDDGSISVIETAPPPDSSVVWQPHIVAGHDRTSIGAPASASSIEAAPSIMMAAIETWGLAPWDLALTFGTRLSP